MDLIEEKRMSSLYERLREDLVLCKLCPRGCKLKDGQKGFCGTRQNLGGSLYSLVYGKVVRVAQEFMETEGVFHFAPNAPILSIGNMGCNLHCKFCQNWKTSQMKFIKESDFELYTPEEIVEMALKKNIHVLSWTYNDPVVWHEFVMDTAQIARDNGLLNLYKSAFYLTPDAVKELCDVIDIFSISLKSFKEDFYRKHTTATVAPILENIKYVYQTGLHLELSNLMITDLNDSEEDARGVVQWHLENTSADTPLHFVRFHPAYLYNDVSRTPVDRLERAREIALKMGVKYCYIGNVYESNGGNTYCPECQQLLINRFDINTEIVGLNDDGSCRICDYQTNIKVKPFENVMKKVDDEHFKHQSKETYLWSDEINRVHIEVTNPDQLNTEVTIYRLGLNGKSTLSTKKTNILPKEKYSFVISKSTQEETGIMICYPLILKIRISELLDRAHLPTEFKDVKRFVPLKKVIRNERIKDLLPWKKGLHPWVVRNVTFPLYLRLKGLEILDFVNELEMTQGYDVEQMRAFQLKKLKALLMHCNEHVPYYREIFESLDLHPEDFKEIDDIQLLPFLEKRDFIDNYDRIKAIDKNIPFFNVQTSGSTGMPLPMLYDYRATAYSIATRIRAAGWWNLDYGMREAHLWGRGLDKTNFRLWLSDLLVRNKVLLSTINLTDEIMYTHYRELVRFKPEIIFGNPSAIYIFTRFLLENKLDISNIRLKAIISTTELLHEFQRQFMESTYNCPVINEYGATETGIIAVECWKHNMHLNTDTLIIEVIKNGRPAKPGEFGEFVITDLNNYINPVIRYRLGDVGSFIQKTCTCGVKLPLIDLAIGRDCDIIVLEDRELPGAVLFGGIGKELISVVNGELESYKIYQKDLDKFLFQAVLRTQKLKRKLEHHTKHVMTEILGSNVSVEFEYVDNIPRDDSGKLRYFVSEVLNR